MVSVKLENLQQHGSYDVVPAWILTCKARLSKTRQLCRGASNLSELSICSIVNMAKSHGVYKDSDVQAVPLAIETALS
jgi:hypothetical protein